MLNMRKNQIMELFRTLKEVNTAIMTLLSSEETEVINLLSKCQEIAIMIGTDLEKRGSQVQGVVALLEKYCEDIYRMGTVLCDAEACKKYQSVIAAYLEEVEQGIHSILGNKKEIVFFPYMAAMWDSMESVWQAAAEDDECDVYVVPIPYYERDVDGNLAKLHYEGEQFPANVPIVSWEEYDVKTRKPDMVVFHNPYDEYNNVTCVHQEFFASNLRKYTKTLVYIPYFVHRNDEVEKHYAYTPGTFYADKVILQSEKVREQYIEYYCEIAEIEDKNTVSDKFVAWGSPKFDKQNRAYDIPDEWQEYLKDGRKVLFLNTHLSQVMENNWDAFYKKMQWLFQQIQNQNKVVLLWRSHPLMLKTIHSNNPKCEEDYRNLIDYYKKQHIGIYDDTSALDRAIALSDAYYGDYSSVAELFIALNKPVMYMNTGVLCDSMESSYKAVLNGTTMCIEDKTAWFLSVEASLLLKMDMDTGACEMESVIPDSSKKRAEGRANCVKVQQYILVLPVLAGDIWIYDTEKKKWYKLYLEKKISRMDIKTCYQYEDKLYLFASSLKKILVVDINMLAIVQYIDLSDNTEGMYHPLEQILNHAIYYVSSNSPAIFKYDLVTEKIVRYRIDVDEYGFGGIVYDGNQFWLSGYQRKIYAWSEEKHKTYEIGLDMKKYREYDEVGENQQEIGSRYKFPMMGFQVVLNDIYWMISIGYTNNIVFFDVKSGKSGEISVLDLLGLTEYEDFCMRWYLEYIREERYLGIVSYQYNVNFELDTLTHTLCARNRSFGNNFMKSVHSTLFSNQLTYLEGLAIERAGFAYCITDNMNMPKLEQDKQRVGQYIYKQLMNCREEN